MRRVGLELGAAEMVRIQRKSFKKWLFISVLCGAHSFFWGAVAQANFVAMLLGILTLAVVFAAVESHPKYQVKRAAAPRFARALDGGVRFRCWLAVYIMLSPVLVPLLGVLTHNALVLALVGSPYSAEMFIGMGAMSFAEFLVGIDLDLARGSMPLLDNMAATYLTTLITGSIHTVLLGIICLLAYGVVCWRGRGKVITDESTPQ